MALLIYYLNNRLYEWCVSMGLIAVSIEMIIWPGVMQAPSLQLLVKYVSPTLVASLFMTCSVTCVIALLANGTSRFIAPRVRSFAALFRAVVWFQFSISTIQSSVDQGYPYTIIPFWVMFMIADFWVTYRAMLDVRTSN